MSEFDVRLGNKLKKLRDQVGLNQQHISTLLEIPRSALALIESGKRPLSIEEFDLICRIYRISPNEILGWNRTKVNLNDEENK